jgi:vanillate O-demethylase ferredoxin subunit
LKPAETIAVRVARKTREADGVMSFDLVAVDNTLAPFTAGSHIDVHLPGGEIRQYSLYNDPRDTARYCVAVLLDEKGRGGSRSMHEAVHVGDTLRISAPRNAFPLDEVATEAVLVAGGIGITPILAMAEELQSKGSDFRLYYLTRSRSKAAFLDALAAKTFAARHCVHFDDESSGPPDLTAMIGSPHPGRHLYVCGPAGLIETVRQRAMEIGWAEGTVHYERFAPSASGITANDGAFEIVVNSTGAVYKVPSNATIAQVLRQHGHRIPTSCEQGICGTCLTGVIEGVVDHRDDFLSPEERSSSTEMTICCSRALSARLVLDL